MERFLKLFQGSEQSHGVQNIRENGTITHHSVDGPATPDDYVAHLAGKTGLGLCPVRSDGTCRFGAIDIDDDTINHQILYKKIQESKIPANVCRSKSGGAHVYVFAEEPGIKSAVMMTVLRRWAGILGYPQAEVFPKQTVVNKSNKGNWINLPYFSVEYSTRYAVGPEGALSLEEFLSSVVLWDGNDTVEVAKSVSKANGLHVLNGEPEKPPCLAWFETNGIAEGTRNELMFNYCVFMRKAYPDDWQNRIIDFNVKNVHPPLNSTELNRIIQSTAGKKYQYTCNRDPILSHCDRRKCLTLPYGVNNMPWNEAGSHTDLVIEDLQVIKTDPPRYIMLVNGKSVTLDPEEFFNYRRFSDRIEELLGIVIPGMKEDRWRLMRHELHLKQTIIEAPEDASTAGQVLSDAMDFLAQYRNATSLEDILKGMPVERDGYICFKAADLQRYLKLHRRTFIDNNELFSLLRSNGGKYFSTKIKGRSIRVWQYPINQLNIQTEAFTPVEFERAADEL